MGCVERPYLKKKIYNQKQKGKIEGCLQNQNKHGLKRLVQGKVQNIWKIGDEQRQGWGHMASGLNFGLNMALEVSSVTGGHRPHSRGLIERPFDPLPTHTFPLAVK